MKTLLMVTLLAFSCSSFASVQTEPVEKDYSFRFIPKGGIAKMGEFKKVRKAASYDDAFQAAAQDCFNYYKQSSHLTEDRGLDIIDTCANPRS